MTDQLQLNKSALLLVVLLSSLTVSIRGSNDFWLSMDFPVQWFSHGIFGKKWDIELKFICILVYKGESSAWAAFHHTFWKFQWWTQNEICFDKFHVHFLLHKINIKVMVLSVHMLANSWIGNMLWWFSLHSHFWF